MNKELFRNALIDANEVAVPPADAVHRSEHAASSDEGVQGNEVQELAPTATGADGNRRRRGSAGERGAGTGTDGNRRRRLYV